MKGPCPEAPVKPITEKGQPVFESSNVHLPLGFQTYSTLKPAWLSLDFLPFSTYYTYNLAAQCTGSGFFLQTTAFI